MSSLLAGLVRERTLGRGATSEVWLARTPSGERVALKLASDPAHHARLADEAERLIGVDSPALAAVLDVGLIDGRACVALEWAPGKRLSESTLDPAELAQIVARDIGAALRDLHALGVAHGDVKPDNIVVDGSTRRARLVDLGLSTDVDERTPQGGTLAYLDPASTSDARTRDLFAFGKVLSELSEEQSSLAGVARALLSPVPGARPSAEWVWRQSGARESAEDAHDRARRAVRRSYLAVRRAEVLRAGHYETVRIGPGGAPRAWLEAALSLAQKLALLRESVRDGEAATLADLDALGRARWLVQLVGSSAAHWPPLEVSGDEALAERLLAACSDAAPEAFTLPLVSGGAAPEAAPADATALAVALVGGAATATTIDRAEELVNAGNAPPALGLELARALRLRGELGRALAVLERVPGSAAKVEAAECERRAGETEAAKRRLQNEPAGGSVLARIALDEGSPEAALRALSDAPETPQACEVRALAELALGDRRRARASAERGRLLATTDEERARLEAVHGYVAHFEGDAERALASYRRAAEHAARAGAVLEEARYLTGAAANATHVGELGEALEAAERALLLFEHLGRAGDAAVAALSRASVYAIAGAVHETREAAADAIQRARSAGERRCRAYAHLALADALPDGDSEAAEHAERAHALLGDADRDDALRVGARRLRRKAIDPSPLDALGRDSERAVDARLEWWGARARGLAGAPDPVRPELVLAELGALANVRAPVAVKGPAFAAAAALAARIGDGDGARRFAHACREAARELLARAPQRLRPAVESLAWIVSLHSPRESGVSSEQLGDVETLVRALGRRDRLRPLLDQVLDALVLWTGVERGLLLLRAPGERLVVRAARNLARADLDQRQLELSFSLAARALEQGEPVVAVDAAGELPEVHASVHALKLRSVLAVPLVARGEALGVVYLDDRVRRGAFGPSELSWVRLVATIAAVAIADARDQLLLRRTARRAERAERRLAEELARREAALDVAERELARTRGGRGTRFSYDAIVGTSERLLRMLRLMDKVSAAEIPVLVIGESGSGKELVARAIHTNSPRRDAPFVSENCGAIPETLLESTLFGHVRGAFTGASRPRAGLFEVADGGTLFLDEIGEMSLGMQTKLLRVLEDGELRAVGSERARKVDVRIIGATHRDLEAMVAAGQFRQDLLYRINVITLEVPALRDRPSDIPALVDYFVTKHSPKNQKIRITKSAFDALQRFPWPGNVRQLENEVRRALVMAESTIDLEHLSPDVRGTASGRPGVTDELNVRQRVDALEADLVSTALERTGGNQTRAAELLGLSRFGLQKMLKRLSIDPIRPKS